MDLLAAHPWVLTLTVLFGALYLFVSERLPVDVTALLIPVTLGVLGVLAPKEAMAGFGNPAVVTVAAMFVLSRALVESGSVSVLGGALQRIAVGERRALMALILFVIVPSALINNTFVVVVFIPIVLQLALDRGMAPSRLMLPLSYASMLGGVCTSVGTSTTVAISANLAEPLRFFEPALFGWVLVAAGVVYIVIVGPKLLPERRTITSVTKSLPTEYVTEVLVTPNSPLAGRTLREALTDAHPELRIIEVVRGEKILWPGDGDLVLAERDRIFVRGEAQAVVGIGSETGAALLPELGGEGIRGRDVTLAELVISRTSPLVGRTVREAMARAVPGAALMALQRQGAHLRSGIADLLLRAGDTLLIQTEAARLPELRGTEDFVLLITICMVLIASFDLVDISFLACGAAAALVLAGCLSPKQAYRSLDLSTLVVMGGSIALGTAIEKSGLATLAAELVRESSQSLGGAGMAPYLALGAIWLLTGVLTLMVSNVAAALIVLPVVSHMATELGVSERPFVMAVVYGASLAFATPMGYQTNLLVWNPGGYRFADFVRIGAPLQLLLTLLGIALMPFFFPF